MKHFDKCTVDRVHNTANTLSHFCFSLIALSKYSSSHQVLQKHLIKLGDSQYFYEARLEKDRDGVLTVKILLSVFINGSKLPVHHCIKKHSAHTVVSKRCFLIAKK